MDRSSGRMPDPIPGPPNGERRRCVRQKLYTPVYASFNGPQTGMVVDLSELLDVHEEGFAVQTGQRLEKNRAVSLCLDLPETRSFIHGSGLVIWSDDAGRGGIRFSALSESSRKILKEWLFANLLIACSNHAARTEQRVQSSVETGLAPSQPRQTAFPQLDTVRSEVRDLGDDVDAVFHLVTESALNLTGAAGAALAFLTDDSMVCRARAGELSPPLGFPVDAKQGLSGECVRTGLLVSCEDLENDPRVDPEIGRALGIRSLMAVPIVSDFRVVGLLEIFYPHPFGFAKTHATILERLVEMIPRTREETPPLETPQAEPPPLAQTAPAPSPAPKPAVEAALAPSPEMTKTAESGEAGICAVEVNPFGFDSMHAIREALWEPEPEAPNREAPKKVRRPLPEEMASKEIPEPALEPPPAAPSRLPHLLLLGLAVAVVALALGYLLGPVIEARWADKPQATQRPAQRAQPRSLAELRSLADHGDAEAQYQVGVLYHNGEGVPQDDTQAMLYFQLAAEQGHVDAQSSLGAYYWAGRGVPEDLSKAYMWSAIALAGGDENSKSRLEGLASQMTRTQVSAARQQAELWMNQHSAKPTTR